MQTIPLSSFKNSNALFRKSSPPSKKMEPQNSSSTCDDVTLSAKSAEKKPMSNLWAKAMLGGLAVMSVAGCVNSHALGTAITQTASPEIEKAAEHWDGAPVELIRGANGEVVVNLGIGDQVVNPDRAVHYRAEGAEVASWDQRGETVCKQALDIGGECEGENIATVTTPHGTLIIEQNDANSIDIYSQEGGHTGVRVQAEGIEVQTFKGETFFANDGAILRR